MTKTIKEEVQEAIQRERKKTALIVGIPENGKDLEEIHHILDTLEMTDEFKQTPQPTRLANKTNEEIVDPLRLNAIPPNRSILCC